MIVKLYKNTGFDSVNIPESPKLLDSGEFECIEFSNVNLIQSEYLAYITLGDIDHKLARQIDYVTIEDESDYNYSKFCYTVETFQMQAPMVCQFTLLIDAYNSIGGLTMDSGNIIIAGTADRLSVSLDDDNTKFYTEAEPFAPCYRSQCTHQNLLPLSGSRLYVETVTIPPKIVESKLTEVEGATTSTNTQKSFEGASVGDTIISIGSGDQKVTTYSRMITPSGRKMKATEYNVKKPDGTSTPVSLGTRLWRHDKQAEDMGYGIQYSISIGGQTVTGDLFQDMRDNGRDNDVVAFYEVPESYCDSESVGKYKPDQDSDYGGVSTVSNKVNTVNVSFVPKVVYNNKARYSQNATITVYSPVSGERIDKPIHEVVAAGTSPIAAFSAQGFITSDIRFGGTPLFGFSYNNGDDQRGILAETIKGGEWRSVPLGIEGMSNINLAQHQLDTQQIQQKREMNKEVMNTAFNTVGNVVGGAMKGGGVVGAVMGLGASVQGIANTAMNAYNMSKAQQEQQDLLNHESIAASAQISVGSSNYARECGLNTFIAIVSQYNDEDTAAYDAFLTKFGYKVNNLPIGNFSLFTRPAFNYIKVNDITIVSNNSSLNMINQCKDQLKAGVRIWHKKPTVQDMFASGNR